MLNWDACIFLVAGMQFTDGQLRPAADKFAAEAEPQVKRVTEGAIRPAADQFDQQARSAAQQVRERAVNRGGSGLGDPQASPEPLRAPYAVPGRSVLRSLHQHAELVRASSTAC